ncbi:hypothetical protein [Shewanella maritima]|uniref:hypothetical protein n=1 Tax=Shewanella maritima TaxID=2520507 RepID=UPI003736AC0E
MSSVPESDWKLFRKIQPALLSKACNDIFEKVDVLSKSRASSEHEAYLKLYDLVQSGNDSIAEMFDNPTRNNLFFKIVALRKNQVFTDEQFAQFTEETTSRVTELVNLPS